MTEGSESAISSGNCTYSIAVRTSAKENSGTRAFVFVQLSDVYGNKTDRMKLKCSLTHRTKFQRGHTDLFLLVDQPMLGPLQKIDVTHQKRTEVHENLRSWCVHSLMVIGHVDHKLYRFTGMKWIGNNEEKTSHETFTVEGEPFTVFPSDEDD